MTDIGPVFLDANVIIYSLDESSQQYQETVAAIQRFLDEGAELCTSHHVIEEVLHIVQKLRGQVTVTQVVSQIESIPDLILIEPAADIAFAQRYATLSEQLGLGVNDALLLQLILDSGVKRLFTYDRKFMSKAVTVDVEDAAGGSSV